VVLPTGLRMGLKTYTGSDALGIKTTLRNAGLDPNVLDITLFQFLTFHFTGASII
jgi:hypothetical protein